MLSFDGCVDWLRRYDDYLIINHRNPDGDALGSAAALCRGLRQAGKRARVLPNPNMTERYARWVEEYGLGDFEPRRIISVDLADEGIIQTNADGYAGRIDLAIDHHPSNTHYAAQEYILPEKASCGEIVYMLLRALCGGVDSETATLLYIAVTTDTGCFRYKNTTPETLRAGAELLEAGAPIDLNRVLFMKKRRSRLELESMIIGSLDFFMDGEAVIGCITSDMLERSGATDDDFDDIASVTGQVQGVETSVTVRQTGPRTWKISVRTGQYSNADAICAEFGGGGHGMAAGGTIEGTLESAVEAVRAAVRKHWKEK
ncbi:MAG: DHH family phosphoesterase [Oscillospiraceae bacterium]|nr:DHH family phosphoesterase [Oscillospiraceae bacterium]